MSFFFNDPATTDIYTYWHSLSLPDALPILADVENIVAVKESAPDTRLFTDFRNVFGDRFALFAGLDDVALEGLMLGAPGWVSGLTNAFPRESVELVRAIERGDQVTAMRIYRWFMPMLHLDSAHDLVQSITLATPKSAELRVWKEGIGTCRTRV